jgi:hypothetical protein
MPNHPMKANTQRRLPSGINLQLVRNPEKEVDLRYMASVPASVERWVFLI